MRTKRERLCPLWALLLTGALFALCFALLDVRYAVNDDAAILRSFMGWETGEPAQYSFLIHGLLSWPLYWLSCAFPGVAWFTWLQLALLFAACFACTNAILRLTLRGGGRLWMGALLAAVFLAAFALPCVARVTYTHTAALLGAAAVLCALSGRWDTPRHSVLHALHSILFLALAYAMRQEAGLSVLPFWLLAVGAGVWMAWASGAEPPAPRAFLPFLRRLIAPLLCCALVMGGLCAWRAAENAREEVQPYLNWLAAREALMDRYGMAGIPQEAFDQVGWSPNTAALVGSQWFFLDESVNAGAFDLLTPYAQALRDESVPGLCREAAAVLAQAWQDNPAMQPAFWLWLCCAALCAAALLLRMRRDQRAASAASPVPEGGVGASVTPAPSPAPCLWALILSVAGALCMLFLLAYLKGRMPLRAALLLLLPAVGLTMGLLGMALGALATGRAVGGARALSLVLMAALGAYALCCQLPGYLPDPEHELEMGDPAADLIAFAQSEPDMLILYDITVVGDSRLFPDVSEGVPHNLSYWGGWGLRSPQSVAQFKNWDIDLWHFDPETLLREDVLLATCVVDPPPNQLMSWLEEKTGESVDCDLYGESGFVYFFQFYVP